MTRLDEAGRKSPSERLGTASALSGCLGGNYAAEVGYREGDSEKWTIWGDFASLDDCNAAAVGKYNSMNAHSPGRAFSWSCLKKNSDGSYQSRHR